MATTRRTTKKTASPAPRGAARCAATSKRSGERCRNRVVPGSKFCGQHGGKPAATRAPSPARPPAAPKATPAAEPAEPAPAVPAEPVAAAEPVTADEPGAADEPVAAQPVSAAPEPTEPEPTEEELATVPARATAAVPVAPTVAAPAATATGDRRLTFGERLRTIGASLLVILGALSLMFASTGWWLERNFLDTERFTETADEVLDREEVKTALSTEIVQQISRSTGQNLSLIEPFIASIVGQVVDSSAFRRVFNAAVSTAHRALVDREVPEVTIDLQDTYSDIRSAVRAVSPRVAKDMPKDVNINIDVIDTNQLEVVWDTIDLVEDIVFYLTIAAIVFLIGGLALSPRRWRTLALANWVALGTFAFLLLALSIARRIILGQIENISYRDATGAAWDVVLHGLEVQTIVFLVATGILAILAHWIGRHGGLTAIRDVLVQAYQRLREVILTRAPGQPAPVPGAAIPATASASPGTGGVVDPAGATVGTVLARVRLPEPVENVHARHIWRAVGLAALAIFIFVWPHALGTLVVVGLGLLVVYLAGTEALAALATRRPRSLPAPGAAGP